MLVSVIEFLKDMFKYLIVIGVIILIRVYCLTTAEVIGPSMSPNLIDGNILLIETITPKLNRYSRFDLVVVKYSSPSYIIKRIIGLPNDKIKFDNNSLYVNGELVIQNFKFEGTIEKLDITVPANKYYVIGDSRDESEDSRVFGPINEYDIIGKPIIRIWPIKNFKIIK